MEGSGRRGVGAFGPASESLSVDSTPENDKELLSNQILPH